MHTTSKEGVTCIFNTDKELVALIFKDPNTRNNVLYSCEQMGMEEIERLLGSDIVK